MQLLHSTDHLKSVCERRSLTVRAIRHEGERVEVFRLTHDAFVRANFLAPRPNGLLVHYPRFEWLPETTVFVAEAENQIVGTLSMTTDGPAGLPVDEDFASECRSIRREGRRVAAAWRLAVRESHREDRRIVQGLLTATMRLAYRRRVTTWLLAATAKHEGFYRRAFRMETIARHDTVHNLTTAPVVLLRADVERLPPALRVASARTGDQSAAPLHASAA